LHSRIGGFVIPAAVAISLSGIQLGEKETLVLEGEPGKRGGRLIASLRSDPKTFNPLLVMDSASRSIVELLMSDLVHINRGTHLTEPSLAKSWEVSEDGRRYTLELRRGVCFSDGRSLDADDVVFTFTVYLDRKVGAPQRDLLIIGGKPIEVRKLDSHRVELELAEPYGAGERIFDLVAILPRHLLETPYREGKLTQVWGPDASPRDIAGLGPFRLKEYVSGQSVLLERNPHYWKTDEAGEPLPYLDEILFLISSGEPADVLRFRSGETHLISGLGAQSFDAISREDEDDRYRLHDLGPGLEYTFLFFNLNDVSGSGRTELLRKQTWFRSTTFRQAVSSAIDRASIVDLVYQGRAAPLSSHVTPGNKLWRNTALTVTAYDVSKSRELLESAGFRFRASGNLVDPTGEPVSFSILVGAGNPARGMIATMIQDDLKKIGIEVQVVTVDFTALLDRIFGSFDYEASLLALGASDVDPTAELATLLTGGEMHVWRLGEGPAATEWEAEIDRLMLRQMTSTDPAERRLLYNRVQEIVASELPIVPLASPHILVGADRLLGNFRPAVLAPYTLWNAEQLFFRAN
jgi:peptide/nickel transport system substrate-binding protein